MPVLKDLGIELSGKQGEVELPLGPQVLSSRTARLSDRRTRIAREA
jgi:hypothetical protein